MKQQKKKYSPVWMFLFIFSLGYQLGVFIHQLLYTLKLKKQIKINTPVVSIGNITVGGNGKTPFLMMLLQDLQLQKAAIICRPFRSKYDGKSFAQVNAIDPLFGDEPIMLTQNLPSCSVFIGKSKSDVAKKLDKMKFPMIFIDDGFQHYRLVKDYNIVMIATGHEFEHYYLPAGSLRDSPKHLKTANLVVLHHVHDQNQFDVGISRIRKYTTADVIGTNMQLEFASIDQVKKKKVALFCAIASPNSFIELIQEQSDLVYKKILPDHASLEIKELKKIIVDAKKAGAECLVCTEKDFVKLPSNQEFDLPIYCMKAKMQVVYNIEIYNQLLSKLKKMVVL